MAQYYVGIDFGGMSAKAGLFDAGSRMIAKDTVKTSKDDAYATTVAKMADHQVIVSLSPNVFRNHSPMGLFGPRTRSSR